MNIHVMVGVGIFVLTYISIISEKINRTAVATFGAVLMLLFTIESQEIAFEHIDLNTIFLLIGMMIIVNIMRRTGIFAYSAIRLAKLAKGDPWKILVFFSVLTAIASALLDNVTTILLVAPVTMVIADTLKLNPIPFIMSEVMFANIGGTATLIGDPPNIMIGTEAGLGFNDFLINLSPAILVISLVIMLVMKFVYGKKLHATDKQKKVVMDMDEHLAIKDKSLLKKSLFVLGLTLIGFILHQPLGYESATIALFGAGLLLLISKIDPEEILHDVEWPTIFFFAALFILVGALEDLGVIRLLADQLIALTGGDMVITALVILWGSAILSAFLDNIPFVATMIPLIKDMGEIGGIDIGPLWWALSLGACLGGNGTIIGATANVIASGLLEKYGHKVTFKDFMRLGFPVMIISISIATAYILIAFL